MNNQTVKLTEEQITLSSEVKKQLPEGCAIVSESEKYIELTFTEGYKASLSIRTVPSAGFKRLYAEVTAENKNIDAGSFPEPEKNLERAVDRMIEQIIMVKDRLNRDKKRNEQSKAA